MGAGASASSRAQQAESAVQRERAHALAALTAHSAASLSTDAVASRLGLPAGPLTGGLPRLIASSLQQPPEAAPPPLSAGALLHFLATLPALPGDADLRGLTFGLLSDQEAASEAGAFALAPPAVAVADLSARLGADADAVGSALRGAHLAPTATRLEAADFKAVWAAAPGIFGPARALLVRLSDYATAARRQLARGGSGAAGAEPQPGCFGRLAEALGFSRSKAADLPPRPRPGGRPAGRAAAAAPAFTPGIATPPASATPDEKKAPPSPEAARQLSASDKAAALPLATPADRLAASPPRSPAPALLLPPASTAGPSPSPLPAISDAALRRARYLGSGGELPPLLAPPPVGSTASPPLAACSALDRTPSPLKRSPGTFGEWLRTGPDSVPRTDLNANRVNPSEVRRVTPVSAGALAVAGSPAALSPQPFGGAAASAIAVAAAAPASGGSPGTTERLLGADADRIGSSDAAGCGNMSNKENVVRRSSNPLVGGAGRAPARLAPLGSVRGNQSPRNYLSAAAVGAEAKAPAPAAAAEDPVAFAFRKLVVSADFSLVDGAPSPGSSRNGVRAGRGLAQPPPRRIGFV